MNVPGDIDIIQLWELLKDDNYNVIVDSITIDSNLEDIKNYTLKLTKNQPSQLTIKKWDT